jgi:hypothetical protein
MQQLDRQPQPETQHQPEHQQQKEKQSVEEAMPGHKSKVDILEDSLLMPGDTVVIKGLSKCAEFNDLTGKVQSFDVQTGRYNILLALPLSGNKKTAMLKRENCQLLPLQVGTEVVIEGLSKCPTFNGLNGTVQCFDAQSGRYKVLLSCPDFEGRTAMLKRDNCRLVSLGLPATAVNQKEGENKLCSGAEVVIEGLSKHPAFNGLKGIVQTFEEQSGRYNILLASPVRGCRSTMVKQENLRLLSSTEDSCF